MPRVTRGALEARPTCRACGALRDRNQRRCGRCQDALLYQVSALAVDAEPTRSRLVEYALHRVERAVDREQMERRFLKLPALVKRNLTETQALRMRHELESFGVTVSLEEDDISDAGGARIGRRWLQVESPFLVVPSLLIFLTGLYFYLRSGREADGVQVAAALPSVATLPSAASLPSDVLAAVVRVLAADRQAFGLIIDRDGWLVTQADLVDDVGGISIEYGGRTLRAALVRRDLATGLGLFKMPTTATQIGSLGDATVLRPGDGVFTTRLGPAGPELAASDVFSLHTRRGPRLFLSVSRVEGETPLASPIFSAAGEVIGLATRRGDGQSLLAVPANLLTEGEGCLLCDIRPARARAPTLDQAMRSAQAAARSEHLPVYEAVEGRLLVTARCDLTRCTGLMGVLSFSTSPPALPTRLSLSFFAPGPAVLGPQSQLGVGTLNLEASQFSKANAADSPVVQELPTLSRRMVAVGEVEDLDLHVAPLTFVRPSSTGSRPFQLVVSSADGRRSDPVVLGEPETPPPATVGVLTSTAPDPPAKSTFGPFTVQEWRSRFQEVRSDVESQRLRTREAQLKVDASQAGAGPLLEAERAQLHRLEDRLSSLERDATLHQVPSEHRR